MKKYLFIVLLIVATVTTIMHKDSWAVPIDLNGDTHIDQADIEIFGLLLESNGYNSDVDYNNNGVLDFYDYYHFLDDVSNYTPIHGQTQAVPEPATLALMGMGLLALSGISLRKRNHKK